MEFCSLKKRLIIELGVFIIAGMVLSGATCEGASSESQDSGVGDDIFGNTSANTYFSSDEEGPDIGVGFVDIIVPDVGQTGIYPADTPVEEIQFTIINYSDSFAVEEGAQIPWVVLFGLHTAAYVTAPLVTSLEPGASYSITLSLTEGFILSAPDSGEQAFCIKTILLGDVNPKNDELCLYYTVE